MKKLFIMIFTVLMISTTCLMSACNNAEEPAEEKIELTATKHAEYIDVRRDIKVNNFNIRTVGGVYFVDGEATLTLTVYPRKPIKCYNVQIEYKDKSPYVNGSGIQLTLEETPNLIVPADGNLTKEYKIKIETGDIEKLYEEIAYWGRTKQQMIDNIESYSFFLIDLLSFSGYVVVE